MLTYNQDGKDGDRRWRTLSRFLAPICWAALAIFLFTQKPLIHRVEGEYPTVGLVFGWGIGMLSYHQDAEFRLKHWAVMSQFFSVVCLIALVVFAFTHGAWLNLLIVAGLVWFQIQFATRWWARPGAWW